MGEVGYAMWIVYSFDVSRLHRYINRIRQQTSQHISKGIIRTTSQHSNLKEDLAVEYSVLGVSTPNQKFLLSTSVEPKRSGPRRVVIESTPCHARRSTYTKSAMQCWIRQEQAVLRTAPACGINAVNTVLHKT